MFMKTLLILFFPAMLLSQLPAKMIQYPDVSDQNICFTYGDDLWIVAKEGGLAKRLTTTPGRETKAKFSPDGKTIAFTANYDGNYDIYTMPIEGGVPKHITTHGMIEIVKGWTKDGKNIIFTSSAESGKQRWSQAYLVSKEGGLPTKMPIDKVEELDINKDGKTVAMTDKSRLFRNWKRYRGGTAPDIYLFDLKSLKSEKITQNDANNELPMWHEDLLYYLSDNGENKMANIWLYDKNKKEHSQITFFNDYEVKFPSIGKDDMVFEAGGQLYIMNLKTLKPTKVNLEVTGDFRNLMPETKNVKSFVENVNIAPDGNRIVVEARGEIFTVPKKEGITLNISQSNQSAERYPSWSPDGRYIAYWSDRTGEYQLIIKDIKDNTEKQIGNFKNGYRYHIYWSPDSKKVAFVDQEMNMMYADVEKNKVEKFDQEIGLFEWGLRGFKVSWSKDSRYIAYTNTNKNLNSYLVIYDTKEAKRHPVTSAFYNDRDPVFSEDGEYLYFATDRNFDPIYSDLDNTWIYPNSTKIAMIPLAKDGKNPIELKNDTVAITIVKEEKAKDEKEDKEKKEDVKETKIDFESIEQRVIILPVALGNGGTIASAADKLVFFRGARSGSDTRNGNIMYYDFKEDKEKTIIEGISGFQLSADGKAILVSQNETLGIIEVAENQTIKDPIDLSGLKMTIDPRVEWHQIFNDVWRFQRDFFYDKNMHGLDWEAIKKKYEPLVDYAASRYDLNIILGEVIGELNASHTYRGGGDSESVEYLSSGYLGVDWEVENGNYKIKKIITAAPWDTEVQSPLSSSELNVHEGDYLLSVNGENIGNNYDPNIALRGMANKTVELEISPTGKLNDARKILVKAMSDETRLRNLAWIEKNRAYVDQKSNGKIGYVYVPSTGTDGQEELVRMYNAQNNKEGLIIDERFNNGGQIPDRFVELLDRPTLAYFKVRQGKDWQWPPKGNDGPKAMLINGWSGSGGDAFPDYFRKRGLGPLIGTRTWGGLIGISGAPRLIDGGYVSVPTFRMYHPDGRWFEEGHGVDPDIEVDENPGMEAQGKDVQLDKAIEVIMQELKDNDKISKLKIPSPEDRSH